MRFIKLVPVLGLVLALASCSAGGGASEAERTQRGASCVLESGEYTIRVVRGEKRLEFVSPEALSGVCVVFGDDGKCTLQTPESTGGEGTAQGVSIPLQDTRGWFDWLVAAYPEDHLSGEQLSGGTPDAFTFDGADFSIANGSECTIGRAGVSRSATRSDE